MSFSSDRNFTPWRFTSVIFWSWVCFTVSGKQQMQHQSWPIESAHNEPAWRWKSRAYTSLASPTKKSTSNFGLYNYYRSIYGTHWFRFSITVDLLTVRFPMIKIRITQYTNLNKINARALIFLKMWKLYMMAFCVQSVYYVHRSRFSLTRFYEKYLARRLSTFRYLRSEMAWNSSCAVYIPVISIVIIIDMMGYDISNLGLFVQ